MDRQPGFCAVYLWADGWEEIDRRITRHKSFRIENPAIILTPFHFYWESAALAWVAQKNKARLLILRGVSDMVSEDGGEAYDNIEIFNQRAKAIMKRLIEQLPDWLNSVRL